MGGKECQLRSPVVFLKVVNSLRNTEHAPPLRTSPALPMSTTTLILVSNFTRKLISWYDPGCHLFSLYTQETPLLLLFSYFGEQQVLINGGITPSASQTYSFDQIIDTFKRWPCFLLIMTACCANLFPHSGIGHNVFIECAEYNGKQLLQNAYLCVSNKNWEVRRIDESPQVSRSMFARIG